MMTTELDTNHRRHRRCSAFVSCMAGFALVAVSAGRAEAGVGFVYPKARTVDQSDEYSGVRVADPYRWLEDPDSPESRAWIEAQNKLTFGFLNGIPERNIIRKRLTELWDYEKFRVPVKYGKRYFFRKNDGLQNQFVLYVMDSIDGAPRALLDPNKLSDDGTVALAEWKPSRDGKLLAYGLSEDGSDWREWRVRDVDTGKDLPDLIKWVKFSEASWAYDGSGFYYSRYAKPDETTKFQAINQFQKLYFHGLGTPQSQDLLIYERPDHNDWGFQAEVSDDGKLLIITVWRGTERKNLVFVEELRREGLLVRPLVEEFHSQFEYIDNHGKLAWFRTDNDAPRGRVVSMDTRLPERGWREVIPEQPETLRSVDLVAGHFIAQYLKDAHTLVRVFNLAGRKQREIELPGLGTASGFHGKWTDQETFFTYTDFVTPGTVYRHDMQKAKTTEFRRPHVDLNPEGFITKQIFYQSKGGTRVPMFITHKKGLRLDGNNPTLLYGYGGFNIPITPRFAVYNLVWMEMGGVYAVANIRGGGEYGKAWHEAGMRLKKQNCFDDFIAAAEWLIENKYTSSPKLAIRGGSNGGLLVGACMTQRPELFGAALPAVGVMDMLRFNKFTIGWAWVSDYGSPENPLEFKTLRSYSPLHNLRKGVDYPATLITTADHDDRVVPAHSFKFAARLQEAHSGGDPVMIRIQTKAGHGAGKPTSMQIEEATDWLGFLVRTLGMKVPQR